FSTGVHKELLCFYSPYYAAALKGQFAESRQDSFTLELDHRQTQVFVEWLYTGRVEEPEDVLQLYMFADQKKLLALRRSIMSKIVYSSVIEKHDGTPYIGHLSEGCGLFRYMADLWASEWRGVRASYVVQTLNEYQGIPRVFLYEVMRKLATIHDQKESEVAIPNPCNYHEHEDDSEWHTSRSKPCPN
ncbi:hypothetical protein M436DRAFT_42629, partial [Aureobasidium namibiae CBS 147.97]